MLPNAVSVSWVRGGNYKACIDTWGERDGQLVFEGDEAAMHTWLHRHSYVRVWGMEGTPIPVGDWVRKERA